MNRGRYLARLRSTHWGTACYLISSAAADRLFQLTRTISDAVDEVLFDTRHDVFSMLATYQMVPAPVIQGDRLSGGREDETWSRTSIDLRFGIGETGDTIRESALARTGRRLNQERRALLTGTRYTLVPLG